MVDDDILKEAREEFLKQQELKKNKPAGKPCEKCNCIVEPERIVELNRWSCASECESCEEKERNEKEAEKTKYMQQITKEEREIIDSILSRNNEKKANRANSGIKGVLWDMTFDTFKDGGAIYNFAKKYANEFYRYQTKQGIYIFGKVSSGKTHLSCAIANYILDNSTYSIKLIKAIDLLFNARDYNTNKNEAHFIDDLNKYDLLIIDDLGSEKLSEWAIQVIYKLIDDRMLKIGRAHV